MTRPAQTIFEFTGRDVPTEDGYYLDADGDVFRCELGHVYMMAEEFPDGYTMVWKEITEGFWPYNAYFGPIDITPTREK